MLIQLMVCNGCGVREMDVQGRHALCCMGAATTIGHNRVRDVIAMGLAMADPGTVVEPLGLVPTRPELRPADVLSRAGLEQGLVACDIGIAMPTGRLVCLGAPAGKDSLHGTSQVQF